MRCKVGDLAVVVHSLLGIHVGYVCEVTGPGRGFAEWLIRIPHQPGPNFLNGQWYCHDSWLRPIRDNEGQDETLTWRETPKQLAGEPA